MTAEGWAQAPTPSVPAPVPPPPQTPAPPSKGQVLIQSHGEPPSPGQSGQPGQSENPRNAPAGLGAPDADTEDRLPDETAAADITDADRSALQITSYDLDARLAPAQAGMSMRARITVRNEGGAPLKQLALQISSTLHWESATLIGRAGGGEDQGSGQALTRTALPLSQHRLDTDADHTGAETEVILPLPQPLPPGDTASLDLFYSGTVPPSAARLERLGANAAQGESTDWDSIGSSWTGVRGFGNVLWYPVASPQLFLGDGNALFQAIGQMRLRQQNTAVQLRLSVEYAGTPPAAVYFCGRRQALAALAEDMDAAATSRSGIATAAFPAEPLGFRSLSLFLLNESEIFVSGSDASRAVDASSDAPGATESSSLSPLPAQASQPDPSSRSAAQTTVPPLQTRPEGLNHSPLPANTAPPFLAVANAGSQTDSFAVAADRVAPLLREWLGPQPLSALTAVDHPGQPFQDGPFLVAPLAILQASSQGTALIQSLSHAWVQTGQPWMDEGLAQFFALLWTEREQGHAAGNAVLDTLMRPVALGEPDLTAKSGPGSDPAAALPKPPLYASPDDLIYRRKAAAVWWMLRGIVGDGDLHAALEAWCTQVRSDPAPGLQHALEQAPKQVPAQQAIAFEHLLERLSKQDLSWFFADWVLRDRGLPDLTITDVAVAPVPAGAGHAAGWLVAVTVRNEGGAVADVPLVVRSGVGETTRRLRVAGRSSVTQRVLVETTPTAVIVNDGSTPEVRESTHTRTVNVTVR